MKELFDAGWKILCIELSFEGFTFQIWHTAAFGTIIYILFHLLLFKSKGD